MTTERRGVGKRLTDGQRVEIIKLFESGAAVTEADIARRYGVTRSAIWRLRRASSQIMERYQEGDIESRDERRRGPSVATSAAAASAASVAAMAHNHAIAATTAAMNNSNANASASAMARGIIMDAGDGQLVAMGENAAFQGINMGLARPMATAVGGHLVLNGAGNGSNGAEMVVMPGVDASTLSVVPVVGAQQPTGAANNAARKTTTAVSAAAVPPVDTTQPLVYLSVKAIGSVQSPGILNWERVNGAHDDEHFEIVNDGLCVQREGNYQINVDLQHSQPRQNFRFTFKVWHGKKLLGQCSCPLRTKKEISLSVLELRCRLPALAKLRVEFLAPGFAFHESRTTIRLLP